MRKKIRNPDGGRGANGDAAGSTAKKDERSATARARTTSGRVAREARNSAVATRAMTKGAIPPVRMAKDESDGMDASSRRSESAGA